MSKVYVGSGMGIVASPPTLRAIQVVEHLAGAGEPLTPTEVAEDLGLSRATVSSILAQFVSSGWADRVVGTSTYRCGARLAHLAGHVASPERLGVQHALDWLQRQTSLPCSLSERVGADLVIINVSTGGRNAPIPVGARVPYAAPFGTALAAFADPDTQQRWLAPVRSPAQRAWLADQLSVTAGRGYTIEQYSRASARLVDVLIDGRSELSSEATTGLLAAVATTVFDDRRAISSDVSTIAVPVWSVSGTPLRALSVHPGASLTTDDATALAAAVRNAARRLPSDHTGGS